MLRRHGEVFTRKKKTLTTTSDTTERRRKRGENLGSEGMGGSMTKASAAVVTKDGNFYLIARDWCVEGVRGQTSTKKRGIGGENGRLV